MKLTIGIIYIFSLCALANTSLAKQGLLNKLLAPGALIEGHQSMEETGCLDCHTTAEGIPDNKCLDCHKKIKKSIATKKTYHSQSQKTPCIKCHGDHKGRDYNSTSFDTKKFDHKKTAYPLKGAHKKAKCVKCHTDKKGSYNPARPKDVRYFGKSKSCLKCHGVDDIHFFKDKLAKEECGTCHGESTWEKNISFSHDKDTDFKLKGKHAKIDCETCHLPKTGSIYKWAKLKKQNCMTCHKDVHGKNLSQKFQNGKCDTCHSQDTWELKKFDHGKTNFALKGAHKKSKCQDCHKQTSSTKRKDKKLWKWTGTSKSCNSCHKDYHGFGRSKSKRFDSLLDCKTCHSEDTFEKFIDFNHNLDTRFKVDGEHKKSTCFECHLPIGKKKTKKAYIKRTYQWAHLQQKTCNTCHKNPHSKDKDSKFRTKKCSSCHVTTSWEDLRIDGKKFNHDDTRFALTGKHKKTKCNDCHKIKGKKVYKFKTSRQQFCISCHKNVHKKQFKRKYYRKACNECHTTNDFEKLKVFNHNKTDFKLTGEHKEIEKKCSKCHTPTSKILTKKPLKKAGKFIFEGAKRGYCDSCHKTPHKKQFNPKFSRKPCTLCHVTKTFEKRKKFDHATTEFELFFKHKKAKCTECHKKTKKWINKKKKRLARKYRFPELGVKECATCHKDEHNGTFGNTCAQCHTERDWKSTADFHKNFTLSGVHYTLKCEECHIDNRRLGGLSGNCLFCHGEDDYHGGTLQNCGECHRQTFWETPSFRHSLTAFPLRGFHRVLQCSDCHQRGNYTGTPNNCLSCHQSEANSVTNPDHRSAAFTECEDCHTQFSFSGKVTTP